MKREEKAEFLLMEMGDIDDELLCESSGYGLHVLKKKQNRNRTIRISLIAAAASLLFSVLVLTALGNLKFPAGSSFAPTVTDDAQDSGAPVRVDSDQEARELMFSGSPVIFLESENRLFAQKIDGASFERLTALAAAQETAYTGVSGDAREQKIWFCDGNGSVITPYLRYSFGNVAFGTLFNYERELTLDRELANLLRNLLHDDFQT